LPFSDLTVGAAGLLDFADLRVGAGFGLHLGQMSRTQPAEVSVLGSIDDTHASGPNLFHDAIMGQRLGDHGEKIAIMLSAAQGKVNVSECYGDDTQCQ